MDLYSGLIALGVAIISFVIVYFMSMTLLKEKSYDEVKAEQQRPVKEKKVAKKTTQKKIVFKPKKKPPTKEPKAQNETGSDQVDSKSHHNAHVEFKPPVIHVVCEEEPPKIKPKENKKKKEAVKPILVNKNDPKLIADKPPAINNKFEMIHPKDDLELKRSHSREEILNEQENKEKEKIAAQTKKKAEKAPKEKKLVQGSESEKEPGESPKPQREPKNVAAKEPKNTKKVDGGSAVENQAPKQISGSNSPTSPSRFKKKKPSGDASGKNDASLHQLLNGPDEINMSLITKLIEKAELSLTETQSLVETLLHKQAPTETSSEWLQGRKDPVAKLEKQLAEKEKALAEQNDAMAAFSNKLKELRTELNSEKHLTRQLGENAQSYQKNIEALTSRLQIVSDEKNQLAAQIQQLQNNLSRSMDEKNDLLNQRQQLEMHIAHISDQNQQAMVAMEVQFGAQLQERDARICQIQAECDDHIQNCTILQEQLNQESVAQNQTQQIMRQLEESQAVQEKLEHHLNGAQFEVVRLQTELKKVTDELNLKLGEIDELNMSVHTTVQETQRLREENERLSKQVLESTVEARQLRDENESLAAQVTASTERPAAEGHENPDLEQETESSISKISQQLKEREEYIEKLEEQLESKEKFINNLQNEIQNYHAEIKSLKDDLQSRISSNEKLSSEVEKLKKNIEQLSQEVIAEKNKAQAIAESTKLAEQKSVREFLQALYPNHSSSDTSDHSEWLNKLKQHVKNSYKLVNNNNNKQFSSQTSEDQTSTVLSELEKQNNQLRGMVTHYKTIIGDTEGMLNQLQLHVEQEEIKWRQQIKSLESELQQLKQNASQDGDSDSSKKVGYTIGAEGSNKVESTTYMNGSD